MMAARTIFVEDSLADDSRHRADDRSLRLRARRLRRGLPWRWLLRARTLLLRGGAETKKRERKARCANQSEKRFATIRHFRVALRSGKRL